MELSSFFTHFTKPSDISFKFSFSSIPLKIHFKKPTKSSSNLRVLDVAIDPPQELPQQKTQKIEDRPDTWKLRKIKSKSNQSLNPTEAILRNRMKKSENKNPVITH